MQSDRLGYLYAQNTNHTNIPFRNVSSINLHCKGIKDASLLVERLSGVFDFQPIQFPVAFSSVRRGSILNGR